ncbi:rhomboid family intramembrane serine protease [Sphingomonas aestuarii]
MTRTNTPVTLAIAVTTVLVSVALTLTASENWAAVVAGFMPVRWSVEVFIPSDLWVVPSLLTPLSAALIHAGFIHLGFNMLMLWVCGTGSERALGGRGVVVLYLVGAYAAAAAQWAVEPMSEVPMIGASGAVSAVVGAYALLYGRPRAKAIGPLSARTVHVLWLAAAWTVLNLLIGVLSTQAGMPIAAAAHIGGFVAGLALARPLLVWRWKGA